ncbi:forkhead-associated domain-containing protein 1 isoform X4 [Mauremys reevesii]|uniref:forkhead-associated domain-containing protein 1 isoform X4 n=1 Tax=Mauremys reevesii TaxID=260615 RepID=UPI00193EFF0B|nr:forkhead-associated domain-containing protein 1 isoform X4 [Mauremys reevesii]
MKAFLKSSDGVFMLRSKVTTIGRHEDSDLVLKSVGIEDHHAVIEFSDSENSFVLQDFNSLHGTFVNDCHIQNAAVKVGAGDILRFGSGGTSYELVIENTSQDCIFFPLQMSCPPMKRHTAWPGQLQLLSETKLYTPSTTPPQLPFLQSQHPSSVHNSWMHGTNGTTPHPPNRRRPVSAWGRSMTSSFSPDTFSRPTAVRQGNGQPGASGVPLSGSHHMDLLLQEKDEIILKMKDEISHLLGFESESKHKDTVIANLQDEIAVMTKKMAQAARNDVEFTQKLLTFEQDIEAKMEEIKALKEQISNLQRDSSQVLCHSLSERDLEIANLKKEGEKLRRNQALTTGLVTSLQRDISAKEQRILQLKLNADKLKKENREKDNQLAVISAKCSRIKEEMKHEFREREVITYQNRIGELELQVKGLQGEMQKNCTEQEIITSRLAEKIKAEEELKKECERKCLQLQEMGRREGLIKADLEQAKAQLECFKRQMIEIFYSQEAEIPQTVTDQQLMEKIRQITDENLQIHEEEKLLQEEIISKDSGEKEVSETVEVLKKSLDEFQAFLKTSYCSSSLKREICNLQDLCIDPSVLWIHTPVVEILSRLLSWVEAVEQLLQDVGIDMSSSDKGMASYMKSLLENNHETVGRIETLQAQLGKLQESQNSLLHEKLNELQVEHETELQDKIELILLEKEKENRKILDSAVAQEKDKLKLSVEEEKKKVQLLEDQWRHLTEAMLQEHLLMRDKHLTLIQDENELLKQKFQKEIMEYKEQIKQHSETIVALEDRLMEATEQQKTIEEENVALREKIEIFQKEPQKSASSVSQELSDNEEAHVLLIGELAAARKEIQSKQAIILGLKKDLSEAKARMSDMIGELSEKQKMELERNLILVSSQESELNVLREKLFEMSDLVDKKDKDLRTSAEELRHAKEKLKKLKNAAKEKESEFEKLPQTDMQASSTTKDEVPKTKKKQTLDLADLGAKCKGLRHEEIIQRQKDALTELRDRIKTLEKSQSLTINEKVPEPLIVLKKDLSEKIAQKIGLEKERVASSIKKMEAKLPSHFPNTYSNVALERTAKLEMSDALDLSEKMYLNLIHALGSLMNVKELTGVQSVKHLSQDEREKVRMQRQKDLELLYDKISKLKSRLERKEELLKEYESDIGQLRANKVSLQAYQAEMTKLEDEVYREAEENALLKEALERTRFQLNQEKRLNRAVKLHKPGPKTKSFPEKLKTTDHVIEAFKKRAHSNATS